MTTYVIYSVAFIVGAIVMGFEMLGARYLNPYLGSGIYTWASLISTVLAALAAGYFAGGWAADRFPSIKLLGWSVIGGALYLVALPLFADTLLQFIAERIENVKIASLTAAFMLMFWPVSLLGMYSPFAIRLLLTSTEASGKVSGAVYGVSTVGSIVGTIATTFFLIPEFGTRFITVVLGCAGLVSGTSLLMVDRSMKQRAAGALLPVMLCGVVTLVSLAGGATSAAAGDPVDRKVLDEVLKRNNGLIDHIETEYNDIFITKRGSTVGMSFRRYGNDYTESISSLTDVTRLPVEYTRYMTIGVAYPQSASNVLMIGVGGGSLGVYLKHFIPSASIDMVDLDPGVIAAAKKYFGLVDAPGFKLIENDGRIQLVRQSKTYDVVLVDAFRGGYVPFHLLTREFYELLKRRMAPSGVAVFNVHSGTELFDSTIRTLRSVFPTVDLFDTNTGSIIAVASAEQEVKVDQVAARAARLQAQYKFAYPLPDLLKLRIKPRAGSTARILTDDFAPAAMYDVIIKNNVRKW